MNDEQQSVLTLKLRVTPELKQKIVDSSEKYNRSMNADMVARLEKSFDPVASSLGIGELMSLLFEKLPTGMQVKIGRIDEDEADD